RGQIPQRMGSELPVADLRPVGAEGAFVEFGTHGCHGLQEMHPSVIQSSFTPNIDVADSDVSAIVHPTSAYFAILDCHSIAIHSNEDPIPNLHSSYQEVDGVVEVDEILEVMAVLEVRRYLVVVVLVG